MSSPNLAPARGLFDRRPDSIGDGPIFGSRPPANYTQHGAPLNATDVLDLLADPASDFPPLISERAERLLRMLRDLVASSDPEVVLSSLARLCVPTFSDGCSVELDLPARPTYRIRYPRSHPYPPRDGLSRSKDLDTPRSYAAVVRIPIRRPAGAIGPSYDGEMVYLWNKRIPGRGDRGIAAVLVARALRDVELRRRAESLAGPNVPDRVRAAMGTGREIESALARLRATHLADRAGDEMLELAGGEISQLLSELAEPEASG